MAKKYYAVKNGKSGDGIYQSWAECEAQVKGVPGVRYKGFATLEEAQAFLGGPVSPATRKKGEPPGPPPQKEGVAIAYVDGSYHAATKEFACGAVLFYGGETKYFSKKYSDPAMADMRNVAGEILGAVTVIQYCRGEKIPALEIHHDYEGVAKWAQGLWKANKPGTQAYAALCREAAQELKLTFVKVKGHSGDTYNDLADRLARKALGL